MKSTYLTDLTLRLAAGLASLPESVRARHATYLRDAQRPDGGFAGREGESDLYYTSFALRGLSLTGELHGEIAEQAGKFLRGRLRGHAPIIDFLSLIYGASLLEISAGVDVFADAKSDWRDAVSDALESYRRDDGGYAKGTEGARSSTYHTFLVVLCRQLIDRPPVDPQRMVEFILSQRRDDGGFVEIRPMRRSGTNPTAAAVGLLKICDALDSEIREDVLDFLVDMQNDEGGLRANTRIPIADLLSTFTGALTLADLDALHEIDVPAARRYAESMDREEGGFHGAAWDQAADVEYSFYGLAALGLLGNEAPSGDTSPHA
jgi:geranylgeranyl transferase type-2 subunit beta